MEYLFEMYIYEIPPLLFETESLGAGEN
jgi:hypothetical protein